MGTRGALGSAADLAAEGSVSVVVRATASVGVGMAFGMAASESDKTTAGAAGIVLSEWQSKLQSVLQPVS